jgi:3-hydroxyacyl-CoA dehydrogenase
MELKKVVVAGGGVLGTQIGLICAYAGKDVTSGCALRAPSPHQAQD